MSTVRGRRAQKNNLTGEFLDQLISELVELKTNELSVLKDLQAGRADTNLSGIQRYMDMIAKEDATQEEIMALGRKYVAGCLQRTFDNNNDKSSTSGVVSTNSADISCEAKPRVTTRLGPRKKNSSYARVLTKEEHQQIIKRQQEVNELMARVPPPKQIDAECETPNPRRSRPTDVWPTEHINEYEKKEDVLKNLMPTRNWLGMGAATTKDQLVMRCRTLAKSSSSFPRLATVEEFESLYSTKFDSSLKDDLNNFNDDWEEMINDHNSPQSCGFMTRIRAKILKYYNFRGEDPVRYNYIAPASFDNGELPLCPIDRMKSPQIEKMKQDWRSVLPGLTVEEEISKMRSQMYDYRYLAWINGCDTIEEVRDYLAPERN